MDTVDVEILPKHFKDDGEFDCGLHHRDDGDRRFRLSIKRTPKELRGYGEFMAYRRYHHPRAVKGKVEYEALGSLGFVIRKVNKFLGSNVYRLEDS